MKQREVKDLNFDQTSQLLFTIFPLSSPSAHSEMFHFCLHPPPTFQNQQNISKWANFGPFSKFLEQNSVKNDLSSNLCALKLFLSYFFIYFEVTCQIPKRTNLKTYLFLLNLAQKTSKNGQNRKKWEFLAHFFSTNYNPNGGKLSHKCRYMV